MTFADATERPALTNEASHAIRVARVVCIFFMMSVHVWPGATKILAADAPAALGLVYEILIGFLGRGSVPLLSVISGFLFFSAQLDRAPRASTVIRRKIETLIVPMIVWSAILLALRVAEAVATGQQDALPVTAMQWIDVFLGMTSEPINRPLAFLRDIFVCVLIGLVASRVFVARPLAAVLLVASINIADFALDGVLLLRPPILTFYLLGAVLAWSGRIDRIPGWSFALLVLVIDWLSRQAMPASPSDAAAILSNLLHRFAMALIMWNLALAITRRTRRMQQALLSVEASIFMIFCSHMVTIAPMALAAHAIRLDPADPAYAVFLVIQLIVIACVGILLRRVLKARSPATLKLLTGERTR